MRRAGLTSPALAACLLALVDGSPAMAAERMPMQVECSAVRTAWSSAREFTVLYEGGGKVLKDIVVKEKQRVFTPTDEKSVYSTKGKKGWGVITEIPDQREGRWRGRLTDEGEEFEFRAKDGKALFLLAPDPNDEKRRILTWSTEMELPTEEELTAEGVGSCRIVSAPPALEAVNAQAPEADAPSAPEAVNAKAREADTSQSPKKPRKEIRLFGSRKRESADEGEE